MNLSAAAVFPLEVLMGLKRMTGCGSEGALRLCADTPLLLSCGCGAAVGLCADTLLLLYCVQLCSCLLQQSLQCVAMLFSSGQFLSHLPQLLAQLLFVLLQVSYSRAELFSLLHTVVAGQV